MDYITFETDNKSSIGIIPALEDDAEVDAGNIYAVRDCNKEHKAVKVL